VSRNATLAVVLAFAWPGSAAGGPITFNTALPVHVGELILRGQAIWLRATGDPAPLDRSLDVLAYPTVVVYGVDARVTLFGILPFLDKNLELTTPAGRITRGTSGFGDLTTLVRVTARTINRPGETLRLAPLVGVKLPTGADDEADALGRLPQPLQLGSGSWDPLLGAVFTWQKLRWEMDVSGSYQLRTAANDFEAGDEARGEASFQYRVVPRGKLGSGVPSYLFAVLETNAVWRGRDRISGTPDPDSGGLRLYVAPGLQWITTRTVVEAAVQLPVVQRTNGQGLREDFAARLSVRVNF
jgi:hypothetical protein